MSDKEETPEVVDVVAEAPPEPPTPEELREYIRSIVIASRQSRRHRKVRVRKGDLKALYTYERELTDNYGVEK